MKFENYLEKYHKDRLEHTLRVEKLSLKIFEGIKEKCPKKCENMLHLLKYGAILHDIGMYQDAKAHNKAGAKLVLEEGIEGLDENETLVVASLIRYHRGSLPKTTHTKFTKLNKELQKVTKIFSAIIRLADALEWKHKNYVEDVNIQIKESRAFLFLTVKPGSDIITKTGFLKVFKKKKELFEKVFNLNIYIKQVNSEGGCCKTD